MTSRMMLSGSSDPGTTPMLDDKTRALLLKLRKGADATVSVKQLLDVLKLLGGWRVEETVGLIPLHYEKGDSQIAKGEIKYGLWRGDEPSARAMYDQLRSLEVVRLPKAAVQVGQMVVTDLDPFQMRESYGHKSWGTTYKLWAGVPGYRIVDPAGHEFRFLPDKHDVSQGRSIESQEYRLPDIDAKALKKRLRPYKVLPWLKKETSYLAQVNALLGMEPHEKAVPRTRENTGSCGSCFQNVKLEPPKGGDLPVVVLHGYRRPGLGHTIGKCPGERMPPYELSPKATENAWRGRVSTYEGTADYLARLKAGAIVEFSPFFGSKQMVKKSELPDSIWEMEVQNHVKRVEADLERQEHEMRIFEWLVKHWETRPLPKAGEPEFDWPLHAARQLRK